MALRCKNARLCTSKIKVLPGLAAWVVVLWATWYTQHCLSVVAAVNHALLCIHVRTYTTGQQYDGCHEGSFLYSMSTLACHKHMLVPLYRSSCCKQFVCACSCTLFVGKHCVYLVSQVPPWLCNAKELCEQNASNSQHGPSAENEFQVGRMR